MTSIYLIPGACIAASVNGSYQTPECRVLHGAPQPRWAPLQDAHHSLRQLLGPDAARRSRRGCSSPSTPESTTWPSRRGSALRGRV